MSAITWIVIILILVSILVTVTEVGLRFAMLERSNRTGKDLEGSKALIDAGASQINWAQGANPDTAATVVTDMAQEPSDLEVLARTLGLNANASLEDVKKSIAELQQDAEDRAEL